MTCVRGAILFESIHRHANTCGTVEMCPYPDCLPSSGLEFICRIPVHSFLPSISPSVSREPREPFLDPSMMLKTNQIKSFFSQVSIRDLTVSWRRQTGKQMSSHNHWRIWQGLWGNVVMTEKQSTAQFRGARFMEALQKTVNWIVRQKVREDIVGRGTSIFEVPENGKTLGHSQRNYRLTVKALSPNPSRLGAKQFLLPSWRS